MRAMSNQKKRAPGGAPVIGSKRIAAGEDSHNGVPGSDEEHMILEQDGLVFEDPYGDEFEEESLEDNEVEDIEDEETDDNDIATKKVGIADNEDQRPNNEEPKQVWRPGVDKLPEGEELEYDPSAYIMYHSLQTEWPCLSFDLIKDSFGDNRMRVSA